MQKTIVMHAAVAPSNLDAAMKLYEIAICNQRVNKRIESRTHEQPLIADYKGGTDRGRNDRSRTRRTQEVASIASWSHSTRKNRKFRAPALPPTQAPCNIHAAIAWQSATRESTNE